MIRLLLPSSSYLGENALKEAMPEVASLGSCALLVTSHSMLAGGYVAQLSAELQLHGGSVVVFSEITGEPTDKMIEEGVKAYHSGHCDFVIGMGGGSPLDAAKAIAAMITNSGRIADYNGKTIVNATPAVVAVPSTAGTGSEVTQCTIITDTERGIKMLLRGAVLMPRVAVVDPFLTLSTPPHVTAATGLDALTHAVESYTSRKASSFTDTFALSAINRIFQYLPTAFSHPDDVEARSEMAMAAYEAGLSFNNSSVTLVHGMSRPIGALFHVPHGISNAMLLNECLNFALDGATERFAQMAVSIGVVAADTKPSVAATRFLQAIDTLCRECKVPTLRGYGIDREAFVAQIPKMAQDAMDSGSPTNTRKAVDIEDVKRLYLRLIEK